jgi:hypothetical protein
MLPEILPESLPSPPSEVLGVDRVKDAPPEEGLLDPGFPPAASDESSEV